METLFVCRFMERAPREMGEADNRSTTVYIRWEGAVKYICIYNGGQSMGRVYKVGVRNIGLSPVSRCMHRGRQGLPFFLV